MRGHALFVVPPLAGLPKGGTPQPSHALEAGAEPRQRNRGERESVFRTRTQGGARIAHLPWTTVSLLSGLKACVLCAFPLPPVCSEKDAGYDQSAEEGVFLQSLGFGD